MEFDVHVCVQDNKVKCASQYCHECPKLKDGQCQPAKLYITPKK